MSTLADHIIVDGAENRPPMLEKSMYDSWASRIRLFIKGKKHGRMMLDSIDNGLLVYPTVEEDGHSRPKKYFELTEAQQLQDDCDVQATNIILHGLPPDVYVLVNHQEAAKDIWDKGESLYEYYWRFSQLINDMHTIGMTMQQVQVNTKFLNALPPEWSKFVTDVKLAKSLYTTNYDHLYAYLSQHEIHANEVLLMRERYSDPLALGEDLIECINKVMAFLSNVAFRFPSSNNQLRMSSNPRNHATIHDGRVIVQQVQGRQTQSFIGTGNKGTAINSRGNYAASQPRVVKCYNSQGEGHMARQCTQPKRPRNAAWFKEKLICDSDVLSEINSDSNIIPYSQNLQESQNVEQAFWLKHSNYTFVTFDVSHTPVKVEAPHELPKVSLVNKSLKKLRYQLAKFNKVVKNRTTSDAITADEITEVQSMFNQMEAVIDQCSVDKNDFENSKSKLTSCLELETELLKNKNFIEKESMHIAVNFVDNLDVNLSCVNECFATQLNQEIFQKENSGANLNAPTFNQVFKINELKAQSQEKDTVIRKLKEKIKCLSGKENVENVKMDIDEMETINIELEHNAQLQEKVFAIAALKNELRKLKGKSVVDTAVSKPFVVTIAPGMFKINLESLAPKLLKNKDAHIDYIKHTQENADILRELVEKARALSLLDSNLDSACKYVQRNQEVLVYVKETCPYVSKSIEKLVAVTPLNKDKRVRFADPITSSSNVPKQTNSLKSQDSNKPLLHSIGVKCSTSASGSKPSGNTKNNRIS
ncbi:hypothetical protein Tco_1304667, partial [Tanacetum coccineum]